LGHLAPTDTYRCYPCGPNDYVYLMATSAEMWDNLLRVIGRDDLLGDPRYTTQPERNERFDEVHAFIQAWTEKHDKITVMKKLGEVGVPCGAVFDSQDILTDPHLRERGMVVTLEHPTRGTITMPGCPVQLTDSPVEAKPAPLLGEHNKEVYQDLLGLSADVLKKLEKEGVI